MRIEEHPILKFKRGKIITFKFEGKTLKGYEGETIAAALHANGVRILGESLEKHRPRGFYCAIGNCSSCLMVVDEIPNVKTCVTNLEEGMVVERQKGKGALKND